MPDCPPARLSVGVCSPTFPSVRPSGLPAPAFPPDHRRRSRPPAWPARLLNSTDQLPNCPPGCLGSSPAAMTPVSVGSRCCRFELAWYVRVLPPHTVHVLCASSSPAAARCPRPWPSLCTTGGAGKHVQFTLHAQVAARLAARAIFQYARGPRPTTELPAQRAGLHDLYIIYARMRSSCSRSGSAVASIAVT